MLLGVETKPLADLHGCGPGEQVSLRHSRQVPEASGTVDRTHHATRQEEWATGFQASSRYPIPTRPRVVVTSPTSHALTRTHGASQQPRWQNGLSLHCHWWVSPRWAVPTLTKETDQGKRRSTGTCCPLVLAVRPACTCSLHARRRAPGSRPFVPFPKHTADSGGG